MPRPQKTHDHRPRELVRRTRDLSIATSAGVPRSTAAEWLRGPSRSTVTLDALSLDQQALPAEVLRLRRRVHKLCAVARILVATVQAFDIDLSRRRVPDGESKSRILRAVESFNQGVDELIESGLLRRVLAMTELRFSSSMIEVWWRTLKHQWLFLNTLDSVATVEKLVRFYVTEHNERLPHSALRGQTPDEMYFGNGDGVPDGLESARDAARRERIEVHRTLSCAVCEPSRDSDAA